MKKLNLIGYCRVSTDNQKEEGTIEIQQEALGAFAKSRGHNLVQIFSDEGVSGGLSTRPALSAVFDFIEEHPEVDGVLIFKLDRLARDLYIQEHLIKKLEDLGRKLFSIKEPHLDSEDPMRKAFRQFMGIVSELEKAFITMRLSGGRQNKARKGGYAGGGVPLGYKAVDKDLVINQEEEETVRLIFRLKRHKRKSLREIARELNAGNVPTPRGGQWYASTVKYVLENPIYKGTMNYTHNSTKRPDLTIIKGGRCTKN